MSHVYYIDSKNQIWFEDFDIHRGKRSSRLSKFQSNASLSRLVHANGATRFALTESGNLGFFKDQGSKAYIAKSMFQDPENLGWISFSGGVLFSEMFGLNKNGVLYYRNNDHIKKSIFQVRDSVEYQETTNFRYQVDSAGVIHFKRDGSKKITKINLRKNNIEAKGVAYIRTYLPGKIFGVTKAVPQNIVRDCNLVKNITIDPWTQLAMGVNSDGQLAFQVSNNACQTLELGAEVKSFKFSGSSVKEETFFSQVFLEVTFSNDKTKRLYPYHR